MPSPDPEPERLDPPTRALLLALARRSIAHGLEHSRALPVDLSDYAEPLCAPGAAFVTLHLGGLLRGCIGHLEPIQPLVRDVAENAFAAAFRDPRFPPLRADELAELHISISVLTPAEPLPCACEAELLASLVPGRDGVILEAGSARSTFLPAVWHDIPEPREFLRHLKRKAGLPREAWPADLKAWRYHTESFSE
jgi:AmmeMemoRadiSam system protein A